MREARSARAWPCRASFQSLDFWPAWSSASLTAPMNAMLESVAPDTVSTFSVWLSTINCVSSSMATSPMPGVSRELRTVMRSRLPSATMTSTSNCPCLPMPDPMPAELPDPAPFEPFAFDEPLGAHPANAERAAQSGHGAAGDELPTRKTFHDASSLTLPTSRTDVGYPRRLLPDQALFPDYRSAVERQLSVGVKCITRGITLLQAGLSWVLWEGD